MPIQPMLAKPVEALPPGGGWRYEAKYDGFRAICELHRNGAVSVTSRRGTSLNLSFPEIRDALADALPLDTVVDGEIVRWSADERLDFSALTRRMTTARNQAAQLARTEPCHLVLFDVLTREGHDVQARPLTERRAMLEAMLAHLPGNHPITISLQTADRQEAELWLEVLPRHGIEGLVIKAADQRYLPGQRAWLKLRRRDTEECIVGAVIGSLDAPERLVLGRYRDQEFRIVGTTGPLDPRAQAELAPLLSPWPESPWPPEIVSAWGRPPLPIHHVRPEVVVEVSADTAAAEGRWRHQTRYVRIRPDMRPEDVPFA